MTETLSKKYGKDGNGVPIIQSKICMVGLKMCQTWTKTEFVLEHLFHKLDTM